jgi:glycosyltransferase involved in cell wall biosynthesis
MTDGVVSIVLPVYNQADHIGQVVEEYVAALDRTGWPYQVVLVPNNCRDASYAVCRGLSERFPRVRSVESAEGGWGRAVRVGLAASTGEFLCYTNSARTTPDELTTVLLHSRTHPEMVVKANRRVREAWKRRLGSLLYNLEVRALFDLAVWDVNGTPKAFPRRYEKLMALRRNDDLIDAEFNAVCRRENYPMVEVPTFSSTRHGGESTTTLRSAFKLYTGAYKLWREMA